MTLRPEGAAHAGAPAQTSVLGRSRLVRAVVAPIERFLAIEAAGGIVLMIAALVALACANGPWSAAYAHFWHTRLAFSVGNATFAQPLHFWINDGLMVVFFFVAGLEIRREAHEGELADLRRAALPIAGALGGMLAPALLFVALNRGLPTQHGWGIPMATDIAFAVGVLALLGGRVPPALRVLLLALAIIDDIGAIIVVALFYSSGIVWSGLALVAGGILLVRAMQKLAVTNVLVYGVPALVMWIGCLRAGIHPTIAGVILGLMTPPTPGPDGGEAPAVTLQASLHHWVAFGIMPLFALANAGVELRGVRFDGSIWPLFTGVFFGFVVGKPLGVLALSFLAVRLGLARLPTGLGWREIGVVGVVAGVGFTMAIFIAGLALRDPAALGVAKLAVLCASLVAGLLVLLLGRIVLPAQHVEGAALSEAEAEASTEK